MMNVKLIKSITTIFMSLIAGSFVGYAQQTEMTLEQCLEYAKENSIVLKQAKLQIDDRGYDQLSAKGIFLPTLAASVSQGWSAYPAANDISSSYTGSYGVDASMTVYKGGANRASLKQSEIDILIAKLSLVEQENVLDVSITETFVQILYIMEQIEVYKNSLSISERSLARGAEFLKVGNINKADYALLESDKASSQYSLVVAQSTLSNLQVTLKQLLEMTTNTEVNVVAPNLSSASIMVAISSVDEVYDSALDIRPEIESTALWVASAELDQTIAKAGYLPTLSVSAGTGVNHNSMSSFTFSDQMRENFNTSVGANLSVPIFSNYKNRSAVAKAKNAVDYASLSLIDAQKNLYLTIETLHNNAMNAQAQYAASESMLKANEVSLELVTAEYNEGVKDIIELLTEQDNYRVSSQAYLTNKYQFILNRALLEFYKTGMIKL